MFNNNTGTLQIRNLTADADMFLSVNDGGSHINAIQIDTSDTSRVILPRDNQKLTIGADYDLNFYNNCSASYVQNNNNVFYINQEAAATMQIRNSSSNQDITFSVNDGGSQITAMKIDASETARVQFQNDNQVVAIGASDDLQFYHDGTNNVINTVKQDADLYFVVNDGGSTLNAIQIDASDNARVKLPNDNQRLSIGASNVTYN